MSIRTISRRNFLKTAGAAAAFTIVPRRVLGGPGQTAPSDQLTKAVIGVGGMGQGHLTYPGAKLLAICDVDEQHLSRTLAKCDKDVKAYKDFREVIDRDDIDIIHVPTPPHWHARISIGGRSGQGHLVREAHDAHNRRGQKSARRGAAKRADLPAQYVVPIQRRLLRVRNDGQAHPADRRRGTVGLAAEGDDQRRDGFRLEAGHVERADGFDAAAGSAASRLRLLAGTGLSPYHPHRTHGSFRGYWDYDGGGLGDMGMHYLDPVQYILGKDDTSPWRSS